jgi:dTDP-4-dehydrorhamnose reductase
MKVIVSGSTGQLGKCLKDIEPSWTYLDRSEFDLSSKASIHNAIVKYQPDLIINCGAYTNVELAEDESEIAHQINGHNLKAFKDFKGHLVHISTDYVFDGALDRPYFTSDVPCPINTYGSSKLLGERVISENSSNYSIIRTSWVYSEYGKNFFKTIYNAAKSRNELKVVNDQYGAPTYARDLARYIVWKTHQNLWNKQEILHYSGKNYCTWYDFAKEIVEISNPNCEVSPVDSSQFPTKAKRPKNSRLYCTEQMRPWKEALKECANRYKQL